MADPIGSTQYLKKRLGTLVTEAISGNPHFGTIINDWDKIPQYIARNLPIVSIRMGTTTTEDEYYGMILQSANSLTQGKTEMVDFSIHCFASACREDGEEEYRYAHKLADSVKDKLEEERFAQRSYGITDIVDLTSRPSMFESVPRSVKRVIVEGKIEIVREHSYSYS